MYDINEQLNELKVVYENKPTLRLEHQIELLESIKRLPQSSIYEIFDAGIYSDLVLGYLKITLSELRMDEKVQNIVLSSLKQKMSSIGAEDIQEKLYEEDWSF